MGNNSPLGVGSSSVEVEDKSIIQSQNESDKPSDFNISIPREICVPKSRKLDGLFISLTDYDFIRNRIKGLSSNSSLLTNLGFFFAGICPSVLFVMIQSLIIFLNKQNDELTRKNNKTQFIVFLILLFIFLLASIITFLFSKIIRKIDSETKETVLEYMENIESGFYDLEKLHPEKRARTKRKNKKRK